MLLYLRRSSLCAHDRSLLWSVVTFAFFGLLCCTRFYGPNTLLVSDVIFSRMLVVFCYTLEPQTLTPFRSGYRIDISATDDYLCPVNACIYVSSLPCWTFICFRDGSYLIRSCLCSFLSSCFGQAWGRQHTFIYNLRLRFWQPRSFQSRLQNPHWHYY